MIDIRPPAMSVQRRRLWAAGLVAVLILGALWIPWLTSGPDVYVHLAWAHQVMRDLAAGELPVWLPDLNAGFGSPGIRLYSPGGPVIAGVLGLASGNAAAGVRLALAAALLAFAFLLRKEGVSRWGMALALTVTAPAVLADFGSRAAYSELLAVPLAWWLLERNLTSRPARKSWASTAVALGLLWLIHAPTTLMVVLLLAVGRLFDRLRGAGWLLFAGVTGALLTAWNWLPLFDEMRLLSSVSALKGGIFVARANLLGSPSAHTPGLNAALSLAGIALLLVVLAEGWQRTDPRRAGSIVIAVGLASGLSAPLWAVGSPLSWLQFPWRFLLPATLLAILPLAGRARFSSPLSWLLATLWLAPLLALPVPDLVRAPRLTAADGWRSAGRKVNAAIGGNPLFVDAAQNRPPWFPGLALAIPDLGAARAKSTPAAPVDVVLWKPLHRRATVTLPADGRLGLRLLAYPWWRARVDGRPRAWSRRHGAISVPLPAGRHTVDLRWGGNPLSRVGLSISLVTILALLIVVTRIIHERS